jgi:hypothetical protein
VDITGNVYVADYDSGIKQVPAGCISYACVKALGGNIFEPLGVTVDAAGNIYVADALGPFVKVMPAGCASSSCVTALATARSNGVMTMDGAGNLYLISGSAVQKLNVATPPSLSFVGTTVGSQSSDSPGRSG